MGGKKIPLGGYYIREKFSQQCVVGKNNSWRICQLEARWWLSWRVRCLKGGRGYGTGTTGFENEQSAVARIFGKLV